MLMRGIQIEEMSKLGWLIGLVKHAIWAVLKYQVLLFRFTSFSFIMFWLFWE